MKRFRVSSEASVDVGSAQSTFTYTGNYAKQLSSDPVEGFAFFEESIELSRRFRALKVWLSLRYHGLNAFRAAIQQDLDHAQRLAAAIEDSASLELLAPVELSAVCFRHLLNKGTEVDDAGSQTAKVFGGELKGFHAVLNLITGRQLGAEQNRAIQGRLVCKSSLFLLAHRYSSSW